MASIAFDALECLEHEFSDGEVGTSTLARAIMSAAAIHKVDLEGFPARSCAPSPVLSGSPLTTAASSDISSDTSVSPRKAKGSLAKDVEGSVIEQEHGEGPGEDTDAGKTVFAVGSGGRYI